MKSVWNGSISFGMVNIPVKLYSAVESQAISFRILHKKDKTPLQYKRWCPKCEEEVEWSDVVKGLEVRKGQYYVLSKKELEKLRPEKTNAIEIIQFIDAHQIDPIYFDKNYFTAPVNEKEKAYFLFKEVLESTAKVAVGRFVMKEKEYVCAIQSYKKGLLLTTLNYEYEIRDINKIPELSKDIKLKDEELKLAKQLINKMYDKEFDISDFKDSFAEELKEVLKKKEKGELIKIKEGKAKKVTKKNLVDALKASLK